MSGYPIGFTVYLWVSSDANPLSLNGHDGRENRILRHVIIANVDLIKLIDVGVVTYHMILRLKYLNSLQW